MKKKHGILFGFAVIALAAMFTLTGCEDPNGGGGDPDPTVTGVTVSVEDDSVVAGQTLQFRAVVAGTNSPSQAVSWEITTTGINSGTGISTGGLLTVAARETKTPLVIKATSTADSTKSGTKSVTVIPPNTNEIASVTITGTAAVGQRLRATAKDSSDATVTDAAFQWQRADAVEGTYADITSATGAAYTIAAGDSGKYLKVSATNEATTTAIQSDATAQVTASLITYTAVANGTAGTTTSTSIALTFSAAVSGLTDSDITLTGDTGAATKGALTGSGTSWSLGISVGTQGTIRITIAHTGIESDEKTVEVYKAAGSTPPTAAAPTLRGGTRSGLITSDGTTATLKFTSDKAGTYWYKVLASDADAPDATAIQAGTPGTAAVGENTISVTSLTAGNTYTAYLVVKDAADQTSNVLIISGVNPRKTITANAGLYVGTSTTAETIDGDFTLASALTYLGSNAAADTAYTIVLDGNEELAPTTLKSSTLNSVTGVSITLQGTGEERTIQLTGIGSLFTVGTDTGEYGSDTGSTTLILDQGITLKGVSSNNGGLVTVNATGALEMWDGAKITDNSSNTYGGGVYNNYSTFTMKGGEISDNTSTISNGGPFAKTGGTIYGDTDTTHTPGSTENTATTSGHAVYWMSSTNYYRNPTAGPGDDINTSGSQGLSLNGNAPFGQ